VCGRVKMRERVEKIKGREDVKRVRMKESADEREKEKCGEEG
jgi:hypothetical protein